MLRDGNKACLRPILTAYAGGMGGALLFSSAFCAFFYAAQVLFIDGYTFEPQFFVPNVVFLGGLVLAFLLLPGPVWLYLGPAYLLLLVPTVLVSTYICIYGTPFNFNTFYFVWETNGAEAGEFLRESLSRFPLLPFWVGGCCALPFLAAFPLARSVRGAKAQGIVPRLGLFIVALQCALWAGYPMGAKRYNYVAQCYRTGIEFRANKFCVQQLSRALGLVFGVRIYVPSSRTRSRRPTLSLWGKARIGTTGEHTVIPETPRPLCPVVPSQTIFSVFVTSVPPP